MWQRLRRQGATIDGVWLSVQQQQILRAVYQGAALRSQRDLDGQKRYLLYLDDGQIEDFGRNTVLDLHEMRLIETNHKFPSATFLLTDRGNAIAASLTDGQGSNPLRAHNFGQNG